MKYIYFGLLFLFSSQFVFSQISISTPKTIGVIKNGSSEDAIITISDKVITIKYMGINTEKKWEKEIIKFNGGENELSSLYEAFINVLENAEKNFSIDIQLGVDNTIYLKQKKIVGISYVEFGNGKTTTRPLNKNQIDKLFGK